LAILGVGVLSLAGFPAARADGPPAPERRAFDPDTGRNLLNYPPHRTADIRHTLLKLRIPNMNERTMLAEETVTVSPIIHDLDTLSLNAALLHVMSVTSPNRTCTFTTNQQDETLDIQLSPPLQKGQTADITINYRVSDPPVGLTWTVESPAFPGRAAQLYSQGESEMNRYWFACHDSPDARGTSELIVTVPRGYQVVSNGKLESVTRATLEPFDTFRWVQDRSHAAYLVDLVVGKWDVVDVGTSVLPMPVYVPPGQGDRVRGVFGRTPKMIDLIARLTGEPYPWRKYAQVSVQNFSWGGMENTSATTLHETITLDKTALLDGDEDETIVHELGHQWFGDLLTCKSWEHIWLNEGFATYIEALWMQYKDGSVPRDGRGIEGLRGNSDAYLATIWNWQQDVIANDTGEAPFHPAMASKEYDSPDDVFDRAANPYAKGAMILHMLRQKLGDEVFFRGVASYVRQNKLRPVETFQFREAMEKAGGVSLQRFFEQWAFRPLTPKIHVASSWDAPGGTLNVAFEQKQTIDGFNPAFDVAVPVWVRAKGRSDWTKLEARFDVRRFTLAAKLDAEPEMIVIDPELTALADFDVQTSPGEWARQLASGPTIGARLRAAKSLGHSDESGAAALASVVRDERANLPLRVACGQSLGSLGKIAAPSLRALLNATISEARVRSTVVEQSARAAAGGDEDERSSLASVLAHVFASDPSYGVRAAAVKGLGLLHVDSALPSVVAALEAESQHDQIRKAAVGALADMDRADCVPLVIARIAYGNSSTLRPAAIAALAKLAHHDPNRALAVLAELLDDREPKTALAAGKALSDLGGTRARTLLERRLNGLTSRFWKAQTKEWLRDMQQEKARAARP
jgi:aminopeptidase N